MASDYKVAFRVDNDRDQECIWTCGCPVMIQTVQVARNSEAGSAYLQARIRNVSARKIDRCHLKAMVCYEDAPDETVEIPLIDMSFDCGATWAITPVRLQNILVKNVEMQVVYTRDSAGNEWTDSQPAFIKDQPIILNLSESAAAEREQKLLESGVKPEIIGRYAVAEHDGYWTCSCGQPNVERETCCRCGASKSLLATLEDERSLETMAAERKITNDDNKRKRKKLAIIATVIVAAIIAGVVTLAVFTSQNSRNQMVGTWEIASLQDGTTYTSEQDIDELREYGFNVTLDLRKDGTFTMDMYGEVIEGTWTEDSVTIDDSTMDLAYEDEVLVISEGSFSMTFKRM